MNDCVEHRAFDRIWKKSCQRCLEQVHARDSLTYMTFLRGCCSPEIEHATQAGIQPLRGQAKLGLFASLEDFDFSFQARQSRSTMWDH